jgi:hypothetical protein
MVADAKAADLAPSDLPTLLVRSQHDCIALHHAGNVQLLTVKLAMPSDDFYHQDERAVLIPYRSVDVSAAQALVAAIQHLVIPTAANIELQSLCLRAGFSVRGATCALLLRLAHSDGIQQEDALSQLALVFSIRPGWVKAAHLALQEHAAGLAGVQVYRSPFRSSLPPRPDSFWGDHWACASDSGSGTALEYESYRQVLDGLVETALRDYGMDVETNANGLDHDPAVRELRVLEICGGDGSLALRLLKRFETCEGAVLARYTLVERNATLVAEAQRCLAPYAAARVVQADASQAEAYESTDGKFTVCLAVGSVLNGQVGSPGEAEAALQYASSNLVAGGILICTGVSGSLLHPAVLHRSCLDGVLCGSHPAARTTCPAAPVGIEHHLGRLQFFVLRKRSAQSASVPAHLQPCTFFKALAGVLDVNDTALQ